MIPIKVSNSKIKVRDETTGEFKEVSVGSANLGNTVNINDNVDGKDSTWSSEKLKQEITSVIEQMQSSANNLNNKIEQSKAYRVLINSSGGIHAYALDYKTTLTVQLLHGPDDVTDAYGNENFHWLRHSDNVDADNAWNSSHNYKSKSIEIDINDLEPQTINEFECQFWIEDTLMATSLDLNNEDI